MAFAIPNVPLCTTCQLAVQAELRELAYEAAVRDREAARVAVERLVERLDRHRDELELAQRKESEAIDAMTVARSALRGGR